MANDGWKLVEQAMKRRQEEEAWQWRKKAARDRPADPQLQDTDTSFARRKRTRKNTERG